MKQGCAGCSFNFRFPEEFPATSRRNVRARFTKAANWAIRSVTPLARCSTIPISLSPASSATARPKPGRWRRPGIPTSFSIRRPMARCCRSCISTATRFPNPTILARITREELEQLLRGYGWTPYFVEGHEPELMHEAMAATLDKVVEQIRTIQQEARVTATARARAGR